VTFVARGRHLAALRERGLVVESGLGNATIRTARSATTSRTSAVRLS
jgi:ketopantoate reductase